MERIQSGDPDAEGTLDAFKNNTMLYFVAGEEYGIIANTLERINVAGFSTPEDDMTIIHLQDEDKQMGKIVADMKREQQRRGRQTTEQTGFIPVVVGRDEWRVGISYHGPGDAVILLDVLDTENSEKMVELLFDDDMTTGVQVLPQDFRNEFTIAPDDVDPEVKDKVQGFFKCIGEEIDREKAASKVGEVDLSRAPAK